MINELNRIVKAAGQMARDYYGHITIDYKADNSIITEADLAVEDFLRERLLLLLPSSNFLGEESSSSEKHLNSEYLWIVDPIDGTSSYSRGLPIWGTSVGLYKNFQPQLASVHFPMVANHFWRDSAGQGFFNGRRLQPLIADPELRSDTFVCVPSNLYKDCGISVKLKMRAYGSSCYHVLQVARGAAYAALLCNLGIWDIAGSAAIAATVGAEIYDLQGRPIKLDEMVKSGVIPEPLIITSPGRLSQILDKIHIGS